MEKKYVPLVTVIMNVHNGEEFIGQAINSIFNQTFTNWELLIWDNNSNDNTNLIVKKYSDKRIKYIKSNYFDTLYSARNKAISSSQGELITFLDVDDLWTENKLESQVELMHNKNIDFCYSNYFLLEDRRNSIFTKKAFYKKLPSGKIYNQLIKFYDVGILTLCIRREVLSKFNICFDSRFTFIGDMLFVLELSKLGICYADQNCLAYYRLHENNLSKTKLLLQVKEMRLWFNDLLKENKLDKKVFGNLISLSNYKRAKTLASRLTIFQVFKMMVRIESPSLRLRFIGYYFFKIFIKSFLKILKSFLIK